MNIVITIISTIMAGVGTWMASHGRFDIAAYDAAMAAWLMMFRSK